SYQEYYPLITASVIVGITPSALYYIVDKGRIPMYVVEGTRRIKHEDLVEYMEKVRSNAEGKDNISQMLPGPAYDRTANL
ncbi:MAG: hypothetical protein GWN58_34565, partial [Anaerolineae bacterium]|nr:hypothetical protein [Anaerolineae bacterium]